MITILILFFSFIKAEDYDIDMNSIFEEMHYATYLINFKDNIDLLEENYLFYVYDMTYDCSECCVPIDLVPYIEHSK